MVQADPIVVQILEGALASAEAEVEAAIERTARSPMIRDARDRYGVILTAVRDGSYTVDTAATSAL
jgi:N-methylhydantoinase B/oxoprolinase/acetone carboxylase alpha subunit